MISGSFRTSGFTYLIEGMITRMGPTRASMPSQQGAISRMPAIICTDLGSAPDDLLAMIVASAALPLRLVVTSDEFGGGQRARLARYLLNLCGRTGVVVVAGPDIEGAQSRWVCDGLVPVGFPPASAPVTGSVIDAVRTVLGENGRAVWIGQGPMTNLAGLYVDAPGMARRLTITQMGGDLAHLHRRSDRISRNLSTDPASTRTVLTAPDLNLYVATSAITFSSEVAVTAECEVYQLLSAVNAPDWARLVASGYERWFARGHSESKAADPLGVAAAAGMFVKFAPQRVVVAEDGRMFEDANGVTLPISVAADYTAFRTWMTMVVRKALEVGMHYDPTLVGHRSAWSRNGGRIRSSIMTHVR
jgi:inosine-uridine nucleoside N-ribohydrolase